MSPDNIEDPVPLSSFRQWYLHKEIRPRSDEAFRDEYYPLPTVPRPKDYGDAREKKREKKHQDAMEQKAKKKAKKISAVVASINH